MKIKKCIGKNGCGKILPFDQFGINRATNDGLSYTCKVCSRKYSRKMEGTEDQKRKKAIRMRKYHQTPEGKIALRKATKKWRYKDGYDYLKKYRREAIDNLTDWYIKHMLLKPAGILNPTAEMIEVKRQQILLHREIYNKDGTAKFDINEIK